LLPFFTKLLLSVTTSGFLKPFFHLPLASDHSFGLSVTLFSSSAYFRSQLSDFCYPFFIFLLLSVTASDFLLPFCHLQIIFGHSFPISVTHFLSSSYFRSQLWAFCYPFATFSLISVTTSVFLLPFFYLPLTFGHSFGFSVTLFSSSAYFRSQLSAFCYPFFIFLLLPVTAFRFLLPIFYLPLTFGHSFGLSVTLFPPSAYFQSQLRSFCYPFFIFLLLPVTASDFQLPFSHLPHTFGHNSLKNNPLLHIIHLIFLFIPMQKDI